MKFDIVSRNFLTSNCLIIEDYKAKKLTLIHDIELPFH